MLGLLLLAAPWARAADAGLDGAWRLQTQEPEAETRLPLYLRHHTGEAAQGTLQVGAEAPPADAGDGTAAAYATTCGDGVLGLRLATGPRRVSYRRTGERLMLPAMGVGGTAEKHFFYYADALPTEPAPAAAPEGDAEATAAPANDSAANLKVAGSVVYAFDMRITGEGPRADRGWAHLTVTDDAGVREMRGFYVIDRSQVRIYATEAESKRNGRVKLRFNWDRPGPPSGDKTFLGNPPPSRNYLPAP